MRAADVFAEVGGHGGVLVGGAGEVVGEAGAGGEDGGEAGVVDGDWDGLLVGRSEGVS